MRVEARVEFESDGQVECRIERCPYLEGDKRKEELQMDLKNKKISPLKKYNNIKDAKVCAKKSHQILKYRRPNRHQLQRAADQNCLIGR